MKSTSLLACGIVLLQVSACGSGDDGASPGNSNSGGTGNTTVVSTGGGSSTDTTASGGGNSSANGGTSSGASSSNLGGATAAGGVSSGSSAAAGGATDAPLPRASSLAGKLVINEVCPSNKTGASEGGSYPDWIELYNASSADISLKGFFITDDSTQLTKYALTLDTLVVKAGGVLILWADGDIGETDFHLGFSLGASGETLTLLDAEQKVIDSMNWANATQDKTYARLPDGTGSFSWCTAGTPNRTNGASCQ